MEAKAEVDTVADDNHTFSQSICSVESLTALSEPTGNQIVSATNITYHELLWQQAADGIFQSVRGEMTNDLVKLKEIHYKIVKE